MRTLVGELQQLEDQLRQGGGPKKIEKQHKEGKLTARERIAHLIDPGSLFLEIGLLVAYDRYDGQAPAAGVITGYTAVLDPERFEVLIDSPLTATRWGEGNLAGWFTIGHGLVLDSANHFDLQGMSQAKLSDEKERMAFAVDHLGYDYRELRALRDEGVFQKQPLAIKRTRDLTIFRFITTFVRQKRLADEGAEISLPKAPGRE